MSPSAERVASLSRASYARAASARVLGRRVAGGGIVVGRRSEATEDPKVWVVWPPAEDGGPAGLSLEPVSGLRVL